MGGIATAFYALIPNLIIRVVGGVNYLGVAPYLWIAGGIGLFYTLNTLWTQFLINRKDWGVAMTLGACVLQGLGLVIWHSSLTQILLVDISCEVLLSLAFLLKFKKDKAAQCSRKL
jgi:hypothetical protein